jgi:hypothetical protein
MTPRRRRPTEGEPLVIHAAGHQVARRSLDFYDAVGRRLAAGQGGVR